MYSFKRKTLIVFIVVVFISLFSGCITSDSNDEQVTLKILHAGSLTAPMESIKAIFESEYPNVEVQLEPAGSVSCIKKITDIGIEADILASADYSLIPSMMMPEYADWYVMFATNEMVLAYSDNSKYSDEINADNWFDILRKGDVIWAFSNPNLDPCGYRTTLVIMLSEAVYGDDMIFEDLISSQSNISVGLENGVYVIDCPEDLAPNTSHVTVRDKSVELVSMLEEGGIDYAWEYLSVAKQNDLNYVMLPNAINLSSIDFEDAYKTVAIRTFDGNVKVAKPIVYGITIPKNAPNAEMAAEFLKYVINSEGQTVFEEKGQPPIIPAKTMDYDKMPLSLRELVMMI